MKDFFSFLKKCFLFELISVQRSLFILCENIKKSPEIVI